MEIIRITHTHSFLYRELGFGASDFLTDPAQSLPASDLETWNKLLLRGKTRVVKEDEKAYGISEIFI